MQRSARLGAAVEAGRREILRCMAWLGAATLADFGKVQPTPAMLGGTRRAMQTKAWAGVMW